MLLSSLWAQMSSHNQAREGASDVCLSEDTKGSLDCPWSSPALHLHVILVGRKNFI